MLASSKTYSNPSQVLERNRSLFSGKNILIAGNITDHYPLELEKLALTCTFCYNDYRYFSDIKNKLTSSEVIFTDLYKGTKEFDLILIYLPKAKAETQYLLANLTPYLKKLGAIVLVGEKKCGIKSATSLLNPYSDTANTIDSARHCGVIFAELTKEVKTFNQTDWIKKFPIAINETQITICSLPGVFSYGELDGGTRLLLENLPAKMNGNILDFGCGAGVIASYILKQQESLDLEIKLDLVDISAYALASAKLTLKENNLDANVFPSNIYSDLNEKYDHLISNPPFHSGTKTDYVAAESFIQAANDYLKSNGKFMIVANKFLKYEPLLISTFGSSSTLKENNKFKILLSHHK